MFQQQDDNRRLCNPTLHQLRPILEKPSLGGAHRRRLFNYMVGLMLGLVLLGVVGCQSSSGAEGPPFTIGLLATRSGPLAESYGRETIASAEMVVQMVNAAGGLEVGGRKHQVRLAIEDDGDQGDIAVSAARQLIFRDEVVALVGPQLSRIAIPVAMLAEENRIPMITPGSTNPETTRAKQYVFRVGFVDDFQGQVMAHFASEELRAKRAAVLYDVASAYNKGLAEVFQLSFEALGGQIVAFEAYTTDQRDFRSHLALIQKQRPDVLFLPNYANEIPDQVLQARELGIDATIIGADGWTLLDLGATPQVEGSFYSVHWNVAVEDPASQTFIKQYQAQYGRMPDEVAALTYDAFGLLFKAIQEAGTVNPDAIRQSLLSLEPYHGVTGMIDYQTNGDPVRSAVIVHVEEQQAHIYKQVNP